MDPRFLIGLYLFITLSPLGLTWLGNRPPRSFWDELASGTGMLAFAVILAEFLLSGRFRAVSTQIGMDVTMRFHQLVARTALALALIHPFLYRAPIKAPYPWDATRELTLGDNVTAFTTGMLAWLLLIALIFAALGRERLDVRYEVWRFMHGMTAAMIALLLLHHTLYLGRYSQDLILNLFWFALVAVALASLAFTYLMKPMLRLRVPWRVDEVRSIGLDTWQVTISPLGHNGLQFQAGQFVWLNVGQRIPFLMENPFSVSSAPAKGDALQLIIKELGDFTRTVGQLVRGTRAYVDGPYGNLVVTGRSEPGIALIAGGVGIAPLLSILRQLRIDGDPRPTILIYGNRIEEQIVYRDELEKLNRTEGARVSSPCRSLQRIGLVIPGCAMRAYFVRYLMNRICGTGCTLYVGHRP